MLPSFILMFLAIAIAWYWMSRVPVAPPQVVAMATRIAFPGGIQLKDPTGAIAGLHDPDEIVIPHEHAVLVIDYPLSTPATIEITAPIHHGFTRAELVKTVCEEYANVYEAEEATAHVKPLALEERTGASRRRNRTDGLYGIWGHDLDDLVLTSIRWTRNTRGVITVELHVVA